jgi:hypothetical protein
MGKAWENNSTNMRFPVSFLLDVTLSLLSQSYDKIGIYIKYTWTGLELTAT